jgi:hypothetical protein
MHPVRSKVQPPERWFHEANFKISEKLKKH